jgi:hypothetical protein
MSEPQTLGLEPKQANSVHVSTEAPVERWGIYEWSAEVAGDDPDEAVLSATFQLGERSLTVAGFRDGPGRYQVRFMPDAPGEWCFQIASDLPELDRRGGSFTCVEPGPSNHGPVRVSAGFHFAHADGIPYRPIGTTCYAWNHQPAELRSQTLGSLRAGPFNKLRMCVFPKRYIYNADEPELHAFAQNADGSLDFDRFEPRFFRELEARIGELQALGIEADLILFHPYDTWGYQDMSAEQDERYLRHLVARVAAFRNVWWSIANEFDLMAKPPESWPRFLEILAEADPYRHLTSIHNAERMFDHHHPGITHVSVQSWDVKRTREWRDRFGKPVVNDEPEYEGDVPLPWGSISPRELVHRFWITALNGGYAGHGETYLDEHDVLWWSKGGRLKGESPPRIGFLRQLMEEAGVPLEPLEPSWVWTRVSAARAGDTWLYYFGEHQPRRWVYGLPSDPGDYLVDLIDPWEMTVTPIPVSPPPPLTGLPGSHEEHSPGFSVELPGRPYLAIRVRKT